MTALLRVQLALFVAALAGCDRQPQRVDVPPEAKASVLDEIALRIEAAAAEGPDALAPFFDWDAMTERILPADFSHPQRSAFLRGARESYDGEGGRQLFVEMTSGTYQYRGVVWREGLPHARFRLLPAAGGFNFHDLLIERGPSGDYRVVDMYVLAGGDYLTRMLRGFALANMGGSGLSALFDRGATAEDLQHMQELVSAQQEGRPEDALSAYDAIGPRLRNDRLVQLSRVQAAASLDDDRYLAVLDDASAILGDDPAVSLLRLDAQVLRERWAAALADLEVLRSEYPDPFVDAMAARFLVHSGDAERALTVADRAIAAESTLLDAHDAALLAALALGRTDRARAELAILEQQHGVDIATLATMEGYEGITALPLSSEE